MHWPASNLSIGILSRLIEAEKARPAEKSVCPVWWRVVWFGVCESERERESAPADSGDEWICEGSITFLAPLCPYHAEVMAMKSSRLFFSANRSCGRHHAGRFIHQSSAVQQRALYNATICVATTRKTLLSLLSCVPAGFELFDAITFSLCCATHSQRSVNLLPRNTCANMLFVLTLHHKNKSFNLGNSPFNLLQY